VSSGRFLHQVKRQAKLLRLFFCDESVLVVLDHFQDIYHAEGRNQLRKLLSWILSNCSAIITFRGHLDIPVWPWYTILDVDKLSAAAARSAFFFSIASVSEADVERKDLDDLLRKLDGYPLVISIVGRLTQYETVAEILNRYTVHVISSSAEDGAN